MRWLKAAIARLRQTLSLGTATPTSSAGPVHPEPTPSLGSKPTVPATSLQPQSNRPRLPAKPAPRVSRVVALPIPLGLLPTYDKAPAQTPTGNQSGDLGKPKAAASLIPQPAKPVRKAKQVVAQSTPLGLLPAADKALAPTPTGNQSGDLGKPKATAPRTRQPAKPAAKPKQKPAKRASSGKKTTRAKASAPTPTAKRSGASGT